PVNDAALYSHSLVKHVMTNTRSSGKGQYALFGTSIWCQLMHVVELKKNHHAVNDPDFVEMLNCIRVGEASSTPFPSDYDKLKEHIMDVMAVRDNNLFVQLRTMPVVFG
ncbi:hypothetical protein EV363DRAFT_1162136, partial [Boletus edulis]